MRYQFWHDFLGNAPTIPPVLYGLNETRPSQDKDDEQEVFYTTALARDQADGYVLTGHPVMLQGGEYVMFTYEGLGTGVQEFILTVYGTCMPMLNLTRRKGQDIERYYPAEDAKAGDRPINLRCELLIRFRSVVNAATHLMQGRPDVRCPLRFQQPSQTPATGFPDNPRAK